MNATTPLEPRLRILEAAGKLMRASPDGEVSTREICREAGVTAPTLYHHFGDKNALLDEVVADGFARYLRRKHAMPKSDDPVEELRHGWDMHVGFGVAHPAYYRLMFGHPVAGQVSPAADTAYRELRDVVAGWERTGRLTMPIETATDALQATAVGATMRLIAMDAGIDHPLSRQLRDMVATTLLRPAPAPGTPISPHAAQLARQLRDVLPPGAAGPLRATETALLHEWLTDLGAATRPTKDRS